MNVSLIDTPEAFAALREAWDALYGDDPAAHVFLSHRWLSDLHARRPGVCTLVWGAGDPARGGPIDAVLPLRPLLALDRKRRRFRQELLAAGSHWADRTGVLCRPGREGEALPALGSALAALPWERLRLDGLAIDEGRRALLLGAFDADGFRVDARVPTDNGGATRLDRAPRVALPDTFDAWLAEGLRKGTRQRVRRFRRRLADDPRATIRDSVPPRHAADLAAFRQLWLTRWAQAKGDGAEAKADKYVRILADGLRAGHLRLTSLDVDGVPVALHALYDDPVTGTTSFFAGARDERFEDLPAGLLLHADAIERAVGAGRTTYDLLRGDEPYKYRLGAVDETLLTLHVRRLPPRVEDVLLEPRWRDEALATIDAVRESARESTVDALYSQLLESWPGEPRVLERFGAWRAGHTGRDGRRAGRDTG